MSSENNKSIPVANIIVGVVIVAALAIGFGVVWHMQSAPEGSDLVARVHDGDGGVHEMPLDEDATQTITTSFGSNTVCVEGGQVYVSVADCSNQDCVHQGKISSAGQQVICLPHELWIEVTSAGSESGQLDTSAVNNSSSDFDTTSR